MSFALLKMIMFEPPKTTARRTGPFGIRTKFIFAATSGVLFFTIV